MRACWILPNRSQGDQILASDGSKTLPLRELLDPAQRPEGFSHGVPTEILEKTDPGAYPEILFGQSFPAWNGDQRLVSITTPAGLDSSGRIVHLGLLLFLGPNEQPTFDLPLTGLAEEERAHAARLLDRLRRAAPGDRWAQSIHELLASPPDHGPATNVELERAVTRFASRHALGPHGLRRKRAPGGWRTAAIVVLIVAAALVALYGLHGGSVEL